MLFFQNGYVSIIYRVLFLQCSNAACHRSSGLILRKGPNTHIRIGRLRRGGRHRSLSPSGRHIGASVHDGDDAHLDEIAGRMQLVAVPQNVETQPEGDGKHDCGSTRQFTFK